MGGLESVVRMLAEGHNRAGHRVVVAGVVTPSPMPHPFLASLRDAGVETAPIAVQTRNYAAERAAIRTLCAAIRPSVVHSHGYRPDVVDAGVARSLGIPTVTTVHGFTGGGIRNRMYEWIQEAALRRFTAVVAVSRTIEQRLRRRGVHSDRLHIIGNAFDAGGARLARDAARSALGIPANQFTLGQVGRLSREKGPDILVSALARAMTQDLHLSLLGDGPERAALMALASRLGVSERIRWHGPVPNASATFTAFDGLVLSSRTEGVPIVLLEAMAAGTPIVASRVGGVPDMLSDAEALLVPPDDSAALASALDALRADPAAAAARATAARARLEREFALEPWLRRYEALYRSLTDPVPTPGMA
ncbi:MAG TPA: glycosyltransferase [Gemmatimonadaceae bacterium]|nr:glycosyltransferase [Gemmatimonadaceae bacterium]